jgi:hypothetical protein
MAREKDDEREDLRFGFHHIHLLLDGEVERMAGIFGHMDQ